MYISTNLLSYYYNILIPKEIQTKEEFRQKMYYRNDIFDVSLALFYASLLFFIAELVLFYFSMVISLKCSKSRNELIVNTILSITFTTPFILFQLLSNPCAKEALAN